MQSRIYSVTEGVIEDVQQGTRSERAITVTAKGWVPTSGWSQPDLLPFVYMSPRQMDCSIWILWQRIPRVSSFRSFRK